MRGYMFINIICFGHLFTVKGYNSSGGLSVGRMFNVGGAVTAETAVRHSSIISGHS